MEATRKGEIVKWWLQRTLGAMRVGRGRDWLRFTWAKTKAAGTVVAADLPYVDPGFALRMSPGSRLVIGRGVHFRPGFSADVEGDGILEIGDDTSFNVNCWIGVTTRVTIGSHCLVGPFVTVTDGNHAYDQTDTPIWAQGLATREIDIGDDVWLGAKATIIANVGHGAVVGANAVVTKPVDEHTVVAGVPAKPLRRRGEPGADSEPSSTVDDRGDPALRER